MDFFEAVRHRRSIRKYKPDEVPDSVIDKALDAALLAPNSSNLQTWRFYWVQDPAKKQKLIEACLNQGAAKTAQQFIVVTADPTVWTIAQAAILKQLEGKNNQGAEHYYKKLIPVFYTYRYLAPLKWLISNIQGLFRPMMRHPWSSGYIDEVAIKSSALACENFMLAISAQGFDTCPMEGFDEVRVKRILNLGCRAHVVMVISVGLRDPKGVWGPQFRLPRETVIHKI